MNLSELSAPVAIPDWLSSIVDWSHTFSSSAELLDLSIDIALASVRGGFGPFGAVIGAPGSPLIDVGWNTVVASCDSTAHAEIAAIRRAQQRVNSPDLSALDGITLFSSSAPCIQCFGAIYWTGIRRVFSAATIEDAEALGFDEGPISDELWEQAKSRKGISHFAKQGSRAHALAPFELYKGMRGPIY